MRATQIRSHLAAKPNFKPKTRTETAERRIKADCGKNIVELRGADFRAASSGSNTKIRKCTN